LATPCAVHGTTLLQSAQREALRAPALNPVASWNVERRGEKVVVTNKVERDPLSATYPATMDRAAMPNDVVIVGAGAAGTAAAEMLRRCGYDGRVTVIDDDSDAPYDRANLSKDYLAGNAPEEWIPIRPDGFYAEHRVDIVRSRVTNIDVNKKTIGQISAELAKLSAQNAGKSGSQGSSQSGSTPDAGESAPAKPRAERSSRRRRTRSERS
jgi:hypothetical protein